MGGGWSYAQNMTKRGQPRQTQAAVVLQRKSFTLLLQIPWLGKTSQTCIPSAEVLGKGEGVMEMERKTERMYRFTACVLLAGLISHSEETQMYRQGVCSFIFRQLHNTGLFPTNRAPHAAMPGIVGFLLIAWTVHSLTRRNQRSFRCLLENPRQAVTIYWVLSLFQSPHGNLWSSPQSDLWVFDDFPELWWKPLHS